MLSIKLKPVGRKRQIIYRVVVAEKRSKLKGKSIENLGWIDPRRDKFEIDKERAKYWIETGGAQPTDTVHNLFIKSGIIKGKKRPVHAKKKVSEKEKEAQEKSPSTGEEKNEVQAPEAEEEVSEKDEKTEDKEDSEEKETEK